MSALLLVRTFWREGVIAILLLAVVIITSHYQAALATCRQHNAETQASFDKTVASYRAATAQAQAADAQHAREVESRNAAISQEAESDLQKQLADARAAVDRYRMRSEAATSDKRSRAEQTVPSAPNPSSGPSNANSDALVPVADLDICATNTVISKSWQEWWAKVSAVKP